MFKRKESLNFYGLLTEQAQSIRDTVKALVLYCADPSEQNGDHVKELEKASDTVRYRLVDDINRTFITPSTGTTCSGSPPPSTTWQTTPGPP
jgi:uncharacterized protein Yka (UPF0111/DUF47 family)